MRLLAAVALRVGHRHAERQVTILHIGQIRGEAFAVLRGSPCVVDVCHGLKDAVQGIVGEVTLGAAGLLAQHADGLQLVQKVTGGFVDVEHPTHDAVAAVLGRQRDGFQRFVEGVVVGEGQRIYAGAQHWLVGHALDQSAIDIHDGLALAKRLAVLLAGHQVGTAGGDVFSFHVGALFNSVPHSKHCLIK